MEMIEVMLIIVWLSVYWLLIFLVSLGYENYIQWCLGYYGNDGHKLYCNDDYIEWF